MTSLVFSMIHFLLAQALRNLMNKSVQRVVEIFNELDRRVRPADKGTAGDMKDIILSYLRDQR